MRFNNFELLSKEVTRLHYENDIGLLVDAAMLVPVEPPPSAT
jgi:hypothetical protein